jgi:LytS/YehU family sensor histidine kinase
VIIAAFAFILFFIAYKIKTVAELKVRQTQIEQQALLAQMNPHFVFNALNSIQKFILNSEKQAAQDYLSRFSNLMRAILENSRRSSLTVNEEIKTLELYLHIESLRFENGFDYEIHVDENAIYSFEIPTMLLQPFVENAIWHGLMNKQKHGQIKINFRKLNDTFIECSVQDNGVGREEARRLSSTERSDRKSRATQIVQERIELFNRNKKYKIELHFTDLMENDLATGTLVTLKIPVRFM